MPSYSTKRRPEIIFESIFIVTYTSHTEIFFPRTTAKTGILNTEGWYNSFIMPTSLLYDIKKVQTDFIALKRYRIISKRNYKNLPKMLGNKIAIQEDKA